LLGDGGSLSTFAHLGFISSADLGRPVPVP